MSNKQKLATSVIEYAPGFKRRFINAPVSTDFKHSIINRRFGNRKLDLNDCFAMDTVRYPELNHHVIKCRFVAPTNLQFMNIPSINYAMQVDNAAEMLSHGATWNVAVNEMKHAMLVKQKPIVLAYLMRYANDGGMRLFYSHDDNFAVDEVLE